MGQSECMTHKIKFYYIYISFNLSYEHTFCHIINWYLNLAMCKWKLFCVGGSFFEACFSSLQRGAFRGIQYLLIYEAPTSFMNCKIATLAMWLLVLCNISSYMWSIYVHVIFHDKIFWLYHILLFNSWCMCWLN